MDITDSLYKTYFENSSPSDQLYNSYFGDISYNDVIGRVFEERDSNDNNIPDGCEQHVKALEEKGYSVRYSSPGYTTTRFDNDKNSDGVVEGKLKGTARIIFAKNYHFPNSPDGWEWKVLHDGTKALYAKPFTYNYEEEGNSQAAKTKALAKWKASYLNSLMTWIKNLPKAGEEKKDSKEDENFSAS